MRPPWSTGRRTLWRPTAAVITVAALAAPLGAVARAAAARSAPAPARFAAVPAAEPISVDLSFEGPLPVVLTGAEVLVRCANLAGPRPVLEQRANFGRLGGHAVLSFPLAPAAGGDAGSNCTFEALVTGAGGRELPVVFFEVGGALRTTVVTAEPGSGPPVIARSTVGPLPVDRSSAVVATVAFPSVAVRSVVRGTPPSRYAYADTLRLRCWDAAGNAIPAVGGGGFGGTFTLAAGERREFGTAELPLLRTSSLCEVRPVTRHGGTVAFHSTHHLAADAATRRSGVPGLLVRGRPQSGLTRASVETITVTTRF